MLAWTRRISFPGTELLLNFAGHACLRATPEAGATGAMGATWSGIENGCAIFA